MAKIIFHSIGKTLKKGSREKRKSELWDVWATHVTASLKNHGFAIIKASSLLIEEKIKEN